MAHRPRIQVTLKPDDYLALNELSKFTDQSLSSLIGEMVEAARPTFMGALALFKSLEQLKVEQPDQVAAYFEGKNQLMQQLQTFPAEQLEQMRAYLDNVRRL